MHIRGAFKNVRAIRLHSLYEAKHVMLLYVLRPSKSSSGTKLLQTCRRTFQKGLRELGSRSLGGLPPQDGAPSPDRVQPRS